MTCSCGSSPRIEYNALFRCRVICPVCGQRTRWHADWRAAQEEWERMQIAEPQTAVQEGLPGQDGGV